MGEMTPWAHRMAHGRQRLVVYLPGRARDRVVRLAETTGVSASRYGAGLIIAALDDVVRDASADQTGRPS